MILPPKRDEPREPTISTSIRFPVALREELDEIAKASRYTRSEVVIRFIRAALRSYRQEQHKQSRR
jgi:metal-responsive CopG/Arc/MetJ family transcriptional regulator